jgi:hypothetical protein
MSLPRLLALDAGGTSTRAVVVDAAGRAYGYGFASGGNPTAAGIREAAAAIGIAAEQALAGSTSSDRPALALIAMAGEKTDAFRTEVSRKLAALGLRDVVLEHDLLGVFHSGLPRGMGTPSSLGRELSLRGFAQAGLTGWLAARAGFLVTPAAVSGLDMPLPEQWSLHSTASSRTPR